jgi:xanthine dehydrogenase molybdenum-binding subunit
LSQIVADALGVPLEHVTVIPNDSDSAPFDSPTHASRITFAAGYSARLAALDARDQILGAAGRMLGVNPGDLEISGGVVSSRDSSGKSLSVGEIVETTHYKEMVSIIGKATTQPPGNPPAFGVQCVKVAVDEETGEIEILDMSDVHDIGRVVNPLGAAGQVEGAFAQGIGLAVSEHLVIDEASGTVENAQFADYKIPTTLDVPLSRVGFAEGDEALRSEMKGVSETSMNSPAAAIANAVFDAVGVRVHDLPITPEKILGGLRGRSG